MIPETQSKRSSASWFLIALEAILSIGALFGGLTMILAPDGSILGMPVSMLHLSPFGDFLIPGLILFVVLGLFPAFLVAGLFLKMRWRTGQRLNFFGDMHWSWSFSIYSAIALVVWIQVEMIMLHDVHWLHTVYKGLAMVMLVVAILPPVRNEFKRVS